MAGLRWKAIFLIGMLLAFPPNGQAEQPVSPPRMQAGVVTTYRDAWGVPHIYAEREEDGFFGLGYAQAEDQMIGVLSAVLAVEGRAGSVYGDGMLPWGLPVNLVEPATFIWRHADESRAAFRRLPTHIRRNQEAWAAGFNSYLAEHPERVPPWAPRLEGWHAIAVPRALLWFFMTDDARRDCARAGVRLSEAVPAATPHFASNAWAVAPRRTADGTAMLLSDPHAMIDGSLFYEFRMKAGDLDVLGYSFLTTMVLAHSEHIAWGLTTGGPDVSDCYALTLDPADPSRYRVHGAWRSFERRPWSRSLQGGRTEEGVAEYAEINGLYAPVVARANGRAYAVATPYVNDAGGLIEQFDAWVRARDIDGLVSAGERLGLFPQNVVAADRSGSIYYLRAGRVPRRDRAIDWTAPVDGDDMRTRWRGLHANRELAQVRDPVSGYVQNDNTSLQNLASTQLINVSAYPSYMRNDEAFRFMSRADRTNAFLDAHPRLTVDQARQFAQDELWIGAENWTRLLTEAGERLPRQVASLASNERRMLERLVRFDGVASAESVAALNHYFWRSAVWNALDEQGRGHLAEALSRGAQPDDAVAARLLAAVPVAVAAQTEAVGSIDRPYGDYFRLSRDGERSWPLGGGPPLAMHDYGRCGAWESSPYVCAITQRAMAFRARLGDGRMRATDGSRALRLVVFGEPLRTFSLHNFGQSDDPTSPHYDDQARLLTSARRLRSVPLRFEQLRTEVTQTRVLVRSGRPPADQ